MKRVSKSIISVFMSVMLTISGFVFAPVQAQADTDYYVSVRIKVIDDADGWNSANMKIYTDSYGNGIGTGENLVKQWDIQGSVDDDGEESLWMYNCGKYFPTKVVVYTDFGGGATFRYWQAEVKVYVNGTQIKAEHINSNSGVFTSSADTNTIKIDKSVFPYPASFTATSDNEIPQDMTFYQGENSGNYCWGKINTAVYDQYGVVWNLPGEITNENDTDHWSSKYFDDNVCKTSVYSTSGLDHSSTFKYSFETENSIYSTKSFSVNTEFIFRHNVNIVVNDETVSTIRRFSGSFVNIEAPAPTGYTISDYYLTGYGTLTQSELDGSYQYTFGAGDGEITAELTPIKYKIAFDRNGATSGSITKKTATYDKALQLPSNSFSRSDGYHFVGWNTEPDGSGTSFANRDFVQNLTTVSGEIVTLYAQWEQNAYDVTFKYYPAELGIGDHTTVVAHGADAVAPEVIPAVSTSGEEDEEGQTSVVYQYTDAGHYRLKANEPSLENITDDTEISLTYELEEHNYGPENITKAPTCTVDGEKEKVCQDCGYIKTITIPHEHQAITVEEGYAPNCTQTGRTNRTYCAACGETITAATSIAATGHDYYDPEVSFNDDYTEATATFKCKNCDDVQTRKTSSRNDITHTDDGTDRIYSAVVSFGGEEYSVNYTRENFYAEIPYIDEYGRESTIIASKLVQGVQPDGAAVFVEDTLSYDESLMFKEDTKLILCNGAKLNINMGTKSGNAIECWHSASDYCTLAVYGQKEQSGELNISFEAGISQSASSGIYCENYEQYGAKVTIDNQNTKRSTTNAGILALNDIGIYAGELTSHSESSHGVRADGGRAVISGGRINISTGDTSTYCGIWSRYGTELGLETNEDYIICNAYKTFENMNVSVSEGCKLKDSADEEKFYSGTLTMQEKEEIAGKTLVLADSLNNGYNLTIKDSINVNFFIDTEFYDAQGGYIECSYIRSSEEKSAERTSFTIEDKDLVVQSDGTRKLTLNAAPAQIAEPYEITVYDSQGNVKETMTVSIQDYCETIVRGSFSEEDKAVAQALLNYGQLANEYFGYAVVHEAATDEVGYEVSHSDDYKDDVDVSEFRSKAHASVTQGNVQISGVSYVALLDPELRFYITGLNEVYAAMTEVSIDNGLAAEMVKTDNGICVKVTGIKANEFEKTFTLRIGTTEITYNGYAYLYTVLTNSEDENLKNLAKGIYRYAAACEAKFS